MAFITLTEVYAGRTELINADHIAHFTARPATAVESNNPAAPQPVLLVIAARSDQPIERGYVPVHADGSLDPTETDQQTVLRNLQQYIVRTAQREHATPRSPARDAVRSHSHEAAKKAAAGSPDGLRAAERAVTL
ncbi:hypothetical protein [Pseudoclavibacter sp. RFBA6]|uniref:hypothetical protein n=1 Tax=Pseudoclavibacter sp. RFBA6 TaxID=2080573 RepID=UPI000CE808F7|nr:hypothetical protein [Pseudoclavibacter sp. RFBA6]PPG43723.1 hypothetical protein C5C17_00365 [Pseudoclavibacter sp. RFBA6]